MIVNKFIYNYILKKIGKKLRTPEQIKAFKLSLMTIPHFCEYYFRNPDDPNDPLILSKGQKRIAFFMQKGNTIGAILNSSRGAGKTIGCSSSGSALLICNPCRVGIYAINLERAIAFMRHVKYFIKNSIFKDLVSRRVDSKTEILLKHNSYARAHPASEGLRGGHFHYGFIDEASRIDDEILSGAIYSCFRRIGKHWIMLSTPYGMQGIFYKWWKKSGPQGIFTRLKIGIEDQDWLEWTVANYNKETGMNLSIQEYLQLERETMGEMMFRQEILAEFLPLGAGVFNMNWVDYAMTGRGFTYPNSWKNIENDKYWYSLGADLGKYHSRTVICVGHKDSKGNCYLDYMKTMPPNTDYHIVANEIIKFMKHWRMSQVVIDATGLGDPVFEIIERMKTKQHARGKLYSNKKNRPGFVFDIRTKPALIDQLVRLFENKQIILPYHYGAMYAKDKGWEISQLIEELRQFTYELTETTIKYKGTEFDDRVIALALMIWGLKKPKYGYVKPSLG